MSSQHGPAQIWGGCICPLGALLCGGDRVCPSACAPPPQTQNEWEAAEQRWREGLTRCREEAEARLREVQERLDRLPQQVGEGRVASPLTMPALSCPPAPRFR